MSTNIGQLMEAASVLSEGIESPVQQLREEIDLMRSELVWYENKHPEVDTSKRRARLQRLDMICRSLEGCEPVSLMPIIRDKLTEAKREKFLQFMAWSYIDLYREEKHILIGKLTTAVPSERLVSEFTRRVPSAFSSQIEAFR